MLKRIQLVKLFSILIIVIVPILCSSLTISASTNLKKSDYETSPKYYSEPVIIAGRYQYFDINLNNDTENICIIAYNGEEIPDEEIRSKHNYYRWEYDNGVWKDNSEHEKKYIQPLKCKIENCTYRFYISVDNEVYPGKWTIKILINNKEIKIKNNDLLIAASTCFLSSLIGFFEPNYPHKRNFFKSEVKLTEEKKISFKSKKDINNLVDKVLKKHENISEEEIISGYNELGITKGRIFEKNEVTKITSSINPKTKYKLNKNIAFEFNFLNKRWGGKYSFNLSKLNNHIRFLVIFITIILLSVSFFPIIKPQDDLLESFPDISSIILSPDTVKSNETITINVSVSDNTGISSVNAFSSKNETINLSYVDGFIENETIYSGFWQGFYHVKESQGKYNFLISANNTQNNSISKTCNFTVIDIVNSSNNIDNITLNPINISISNETNSTFQNNLSIENNTIDYEMFNITNGNNHSNINVEKNPKINKTTLNQTINNNRIVFIVDKKHEEISVLPGTKFFVDRTIDGPHGTNITFVPMFSDSLKLESVELVDDDNESFQPILSSKNEIISHNYISGIENCQKEEKINRLRKELPQDMKSLEKVVYIDDVTLKSPRTIRLWFSAPSWEDIQSGLKFSSGEISYLVFTEENDSFDFEGSTWWDSGWGYRKLLTINSSQVVDDLENFPMLVYEPSDLDLANDAQSDGDDIAFILWNDNSTQLNHEIEFFNPVTGEIAVWVNITNISSTINTKLWMYYNNSNCNNQQNIAGVWDNHYVMVQHLNESSKTSGTYNDHIDSTLNSNDAETNNGVSMDVNGRIDGSDEFGGDGSDDYIEIQDDSTLDITDEISISLWVNLDDYSNAPDLITKGSYTESYSTWVRAAGTVRFAVNGNSLTSSDSINTGSWYYLTFTRDSSTNGRKIYINGLENASDTLVTAFNTNADPLYISTSSYEIDGIVDEVRISNIARSAEWIRTSYNNMKTPEKFIKVGIESNITDTSIEVISPYIVTYSPYLISAIGNNSLDSVTLWYRYSTNNISFDSWVENNIDNLFPWTWNFDFPNGTGYYEFYSIGKKSGYSDEIEPSNADSICYFNSSINTAPFVYAESPKNQSEGIARIPQLNVTVDDGDNDLLDVKWWSNSSGLWTSFGSNNNINTEEGPVNIIKTNSNFSDFSTKYWWSLNITDSISWTNVTYCFTTQPISTSVDTIIPYGITSPQKNITATGDSDLNNVKLFYRWSSDNVSWGKIPVSIFDGFESGSMNTSLWNTYQSGGDARIQFNYAGTTHSGSSSCAMDDFDFSTGDYSLNELFTVYDFTGISNIVIDFWQYDADDEEENAPSSWTGHGNYDAVSFTNDGNTWYEIIDATALDQDDQWTHFTYNISSDADFNPNVNSNFAIKFQQYDNYQINLGQDWDGRVWDNIYINFSKKNDNGTYWIEWLNSSNPDYNYPWNWSFNFPNGTGFYEFYSIGNKTGEINETSPLTADARCYYNSMGVAPTIELINPTPNGTTNVSLQTLCQIRANDINNDILTIYWYENTTGPWILKNTNISISSGSIVSYSFSEFSNYSTKYWWKLTVNDSLWNTSAIFSFTTKSISTSVDIIIPNTVITPQKNLTATGDSVLDNVKLFYRWSLDNISWGRKPVSIFDGFESGSINSSLWNTYQSGGDARIQFNYAGTTRQGSYSCAMDDFDFDTGDNSLNELYTIYDFTEASNIEIDFWQYDADDEESNAPSSWTGHGNYDAVSYTNDGTTWYEIVDATALDQDDQWTHFTYNISNDADFNPIITSNFAIKFQQYDNYQINLGQDWDGRVWDNIYINFTIDNENGSDWIEWFNVSNPDYDYLWYWNFDFPNSTGYYEFHSIGNKSGSPNETSPSIADAFCYYSYTSPTAPIINNYDLMNITGSKLNNATGLIDVNKEYYFTINITDANSWIDIKYINITSWFDDGNDSSLYNQTTGGNLNLFLQYENISGMGNFKILWPVNESKIILSNCSETIIDSTTRIINITFKPLSQVRWASSNNTWNSTFEVYNDPYSWNFNITVEDSTNRKTSVKNEYGVYRYTSISPSQDWVDVYALPGFNDTSNIVNIEYSSNHDFNMTIFFEENLTNVSRADSIPIENNVKILASTDTSDDIDTDIYFSGIGEDFKIDIINLSGLFQENNVSQFVNVQFDVYIPFGTQSGRYIAKVATKVFHK